jgi:hypothetical protein
MSDSLRNVHELLDRLDESRLAAVGQLLEVMIRDDDEELTEEDRTAIQAGLVSLDKNGGISMEDVLADFGLSTDEFERMAAATNDYPRCSD